MNLLLTSALDPARCACPVGQLIVPATLAAAETSLDHLCCISCGRPADLGVVLATSFHPLELIELTDPRIGTPAWHQLPIEVRRSLAVALASQWRTYLRLLVELPNGHLISTRHLPEHYGPDFRVPLGLALARAEAAA